MYKSQISGFGYNLYRRFRTILRRIPPLRSAWHFWCTLKDAIQDDSARAKKIFDREFENPDPWGHNVIVSERERFQRELGMLDAVRGKHLFKRVLEVGCAEGEFTEMLADRCENILAVDLSPVALGRARQRRSWHQGVTFSKWDLLVDQVPGSFDLIVLVHVLDYYRSPILIRRIRNKLVAALRPGGFLLLGNTHDQDSVAHNAWWGRYLLSGGERINSFMLESPELKIVDKTVSALRHSVSHDVLCQRVL